MATQPRPPVGRRSRARRMLAADAALLVLAGAASVWGAKLAGVATEPLGWTVVYGVPTLASIALRGGYRFRLEVSPFEYVGQVVAGTAIAAMFVVAGRVLLDPSGEIAGQSVRIWAFATVYLLAARMGVAIGAGRPSRRGLRTLIVGAGDIGHTIGRRLLARPELGLTPIGFLDKEPREGGDVEPLEVLGASWDLEEVVEQHSVEHVIVAFSTAPHDASSTSYADAAAWSSTSRSSDACSRRSRVRSASSTSKESRCCAWTGSIPVGGSSR